MKSHLKNGNNFVPIVSSVVVLLLFMGFCLVSQFSLIIPLLLLFSGLHLSFFKKASFKLFLNLGFLLTIIIFIVHGFKQYLTPVHYLYIPVASVAMLTILLYNDLQLAYIISLLSSVFVSLILGLNLPMMVAFFIGSLTGVYLVKGARIRSHLIKAGFYVGLMQVFCAVLLNFSQDFVFSKFFLLNYVKPLLISGLLASGIAMLTSNIFEALFGIVTNFSLLELSDFNHPLLKRMILEAPGTYHHSLIVSNLSEAAADHIGAHALLTRVGAYYHDIGKLLKPEYFTENQMLGGNKHDNIEPSMSRLVILNHVKEGIELGKKYKLNPVILDFIPQHHGTGLIYYFYQKALEGAQREDAVSEENFRYPGPKPQSRETAIVMLADSVEGATRALDDPNPKKIEEVVRKIINNRFIDGQLDDCNLTLKEIEGIAATFTRVLSATYHGRVKYPDKKGDDGNNNQKSSEKANSSEPPANWQNPKDPS